MSEFCTWLSRSNVGITRVILSSPVGPPCDVRLCMTSVNSSYPMKLPVMYVYALLFRRRAFQTNMAESKCVVMECYEHPCFFYSYYILDDWDSTSKCIYCLISISVEGFWWFNSSCCGFNIFTSNTCLIFAMGAAILISLPKWHLKGVKWLVKFFRVLRVNFARMKFDWFIWFMHILV